MNFRSRNNNNFHRERGATSLRPVTPPTDAAAAVARPPSRHRHRRATTTTAVAATAMPDEPSQVWPVVRFSTGLMAVLGVLDGLADEAWPLALRAAWKVALSCSGVYFNVQNFADGRFANRSHLVAYIAAILATALYALKTR